MMSKNKGYNSYYKKDEPKETVELSYENKVEEVPAAEPVQEAPEESFEEKEEQKVLEKATIKGASRVNLRAGASKNDRVIAVLLENTEVTILDSSNEYWFKITDGKNTGFMMSKFLRRI